MIGHKRIPSREGGVEIVVEELAARMVEKGHEVTVYNRGGHHVSGKDNDIHEKHRKRYRGIRIISIWTPKHKALNAIVYAFLATLRALFGRYDVIHYHAEGSCAMLWIPRLLGIRTVATIHGLDWQRAKWGGFATKFLLHGEKCAAKYADEIIVLSQNVAAYFRETYHRETKYIPNGITLPIPRQAKLITDQFHLQPYHYLLFVARIVPEKGLHYLIQAYKKLETEMPLVIAGGSSHSDAYRNEIIQMAAEDQRIIFTGFVQGKLLEELYSNCFLYLLPSDVEGMPISLLEALSYGRECLVSDIPENKEIIGNMATTFVKSSQEDLQKKLEILLQQKQQGNLADRSKAIAEYVTKRFNWDEVVTQTIELYCI